MVYLYTFIDNDNSYQYHIITNKDCYDLLQDIESYYYDFEDYNTKDELITQLKQYDVDQRLIDYIDTLDDLSFDGISTFTYDVLDYIDALVPFDENEFYY